MEVGSKVSTRVTETWQRVAASACLRRVGVVSTINSSHFVPSLCVGICVVGEHLPRRLPSHFSFTHSPSAASRTGELQPTKPQWRDRRLRAVEFVFASRYKELAL